MEPSSLAALAAAGVGAGAVNAAAGGGSLISFPTLLALGHPPVTANVTNTVAALPGYLGGAWGYRRQLSGQRRRLATLGVVTVVGAVGGSTVLLIAPAEAFVAVVPWLVLASTLLLAVQPWITAVTKRRAERSTGPTPERLGTAALGQLGVGVYGGYFNAGLGLMMLGVLGCTLHDDLQRLNALKSALSAVASAVSTTYFIMFATVSWSAALVLAVGGLIGGWAGSALAQRVPARILRWSVVSVGLAVFLVLLVDAHAS